MIPPCYHVARCRFYRLPKSANSAEIIDPTLERKMVFRPCLIDLAAASQAARKKDAARYAVGPTQREVDHYV